MSSKIEALAARVQERLGDKLVRVPSNTGELAYEVASERLLEVGRSLRDDFGFEMLMDVCGVDYLQYGETQWQTVDSTDQGFSRAVDRSSVGFELLRAADDDAAPVPKDDSASGGQGEPTTVRKPARRFAVVYHLLSIGRNARLRLKTFCPDDERPLVDSVTPIWSSANWFEREAFDLFGILFRDHPDLRRILTDYGFIGHPFRKDFPLIGKVEVRYDPERGRVAYEPVSIEPRTLVPRVIRDDQRYNPQIHNEASFREAGSDA